MHIYACLQLALLSCVVVLLQADMFSCGVMLYAMLTGVSAHYWIGGNGQPAGAQPVLMKFPRDGSTRIIPII